MLPPGIYKTFPYSCIVVVPGSCGDDKSIVRPAPGNYPMPTIKPGLQFIPLYQPKK